MGGTLAHSSVFHQGVQLPMLPPTPPLVWASSSQPVPSHEVGLTTCSQVTRSIFCRVGATEATHLVLSAGRGSVKMDLRSVDNTSSSDDSRMMMMSTAPSMMVGMNVTGSMFQRAMEEVSEEEMKEFAADGDDGEVRILLSGSHVSPLIHPTDLQRGVSDLGTVHWQPGLGFRGYWVCLAFAMAFGCLANEVHLRGATGGFLRPVLVGTPIYLGSLLRCGFSHARN